MSRLLDRAAEERLLGRSTREFLSDEHRTWLAGQRVVVTGAGGTIGSALARQLAMCGCSHVSLVDHCEYALFRVAAALRVQWPNVRLDPRLVDVTRRSEIRAAFRATRPDVVYHAAAYKHITLTEAAIVPAARVNVLGTVETLSAAREVGARYILISSDKASHPRSVMGASKRLAELTTLAAGGPAFRAIVVRFGNVLASSGSFVEVMWDCVTEHRDVPVTDPDASRFFMTADEAVSLVLQADQLAAETGLFCLDMGRPIRIGTLVERFIEFATPAGQPRVGIELIGLRPGEKKHEQLSPEGTRIHPTHSPWILSVQQPPLACMNLRRAIDALRRAVAANSPARVLKILEEATEFRANSDTWGSIRSGLADRARGRSHKPIRRSADDKSNQRGCPGGSLERRSGA